MKTLGISGLVIAAMMALSVAAAPASAAEAAARESVALTVYNDGNAIVREVRVVDVPQGTGVVRVDDVARTIDATTVVFRSVDDPEGTVLLEQTYEFDVASADRLLERAVGARLSVVLADGTVLSGTLVSYDAAQVVVALDARTGQGRELAILTRGENVRSILLDAPPDPLILRPALVWLLRSERGGSQAVELAYNVTDFNWRADYVAVLLGDSRAMDVTGWATLTNNTGRGYEDASLRLVAGDVHRVQDQVRPMMMAERAVMRAPVPDQFVERPLAEYHVYALARPTTIGDRQIRQIELLSAEAIPVERRYLFDPMRGFQPWWNRPMTDDFGIAERGPVQAFVIFRNDEASNLGRPLPGGRMRLFEESQGALEFIGEDTVAHTPADARVELLIGTAFDIFAERTRTRMEGGRGQNWMQESFEIRLRNSRDEAVTVHARERLVRWTNWRIVESSHDYEQVEAQIAEFAVELEPGEEEVVRYTVRYDWSAIR